MTITRARPRSNTERGRASTWHARERAGKKLTRKQRAWLRAYDKATASYKATPKRKGGRARAWGLAEVARGVVEALKTALENTGIATGRARKTSPPGEEKYGTAAADVKPAALVFSYQDEDFTEGPVLEVDWSAGLNAPEHARVRRYLRAWGERKDGSRIAPKRVANVRFLLRYRRREDVQEFWVSIVALTSFQEIAGAIDRRLAKLTIASDVSVRLLCVESYVRRYIPGR